MSAIIVTDFLHDEVGQTGGYQMPPAVWHAAKEAIVAGTERELYYGHFRHGCDCPPRPLPRGVPPDVAMRIGWSNATCPHTTHCLYFPKAKRGLVYRDGVLIWIDNVANMDALENSDFAFQVWGGGQ